MDDLDLGATIRGFAAGQKIFGRYTLQAMLGRGGMGVVWRARDESLEQDVALKMLPEIVANDPAAIRDLKRETRRCQALAHPHILKVHDFVEGGGLYGISMELVEGGTLAARRLAQPTETFTPAQLLPWVGQLCDALQYAHQKAQVVHRDLKPANLMLAKNGDLKVADFGISASVSDSVSRVSVAAGSSGTPVFMSPQQMMGEKPAITDDIYAFGATLYELLTGKPPFHSGNVMMQVQNKVPPSVAARRAELGHDDAELRSPFINEAWEETIAACLAKDPAARPQSAREILERLNASSKPAGPRSVPVAAASATAPHAGGQKSRGPLLAGLVAAVLLLGAAGYYFGVVVPEQARQEQAKRELAAQQLQAQRNLEAKQRAEELRLANARGGLVIRTTPANTEVQIGGFALEHGPAATLKEVRLGKYPVVARAPDHEDWKGEVVVEENKFANLDISLVRSTGSVELASEPAGVAFVLQAAGAEGARREGVTPARLDGLPTGSYTVDFKKKGLRGQTATGTVARGQALKLSATLPTAKLDDAGYVIQQVLENIEKVSDPVVRTTLLHSLCSAVERERSSGKDELLRLHELRFQAARKIADPFDRANWLRNGVSYITALDSNLTRRSLTEAFDAMKLIADPERRLSMARYVVMEAWSEPELGLKYLEEYSRMARDDRHNYEVSNLPELYARYGLASDGRALPSQSSAAPDAKSAEEPFARGWAWRQGRTAMDLVRKGDRVGARAIMEKLPAEIHYSPCIDLIYGFSRLGEFDLAQLAANHGTENYRKKDTLDWLASAARLYDRPDLAAEYIRRLEDKSAREINWRNLALYYADHGLRREARSAAINIEGVGSGSTSFFAGMWSLIGEKEKARQAAALNPAFRGDAPTKGSPSDATDFVLLGDMIGLERQETFFAADTVSNRGAFYFACSSGYAYLNRRQEALDMCGKIPAGDNRIYAYEGVGAKIAATSGLDDFAGWVESLPVGEIRAGLLVGWLGEMGHKHLLAQLGLPVRQN